MLINYVPLVLALASAVTILWFTDRGQSARAGRVHTISGITIPIAWIVLQGINLVTL
jgi:hypothetical protein